MSAIKILLVEDERLIAEDIRNRLTGIGYAVTAVAGTGEEAVRSAVKKNPDLVLMDILLRGDMDGIEAAALIRKRLDVPVVYMTAHSDRITLDRLKKTEPHGFLLKPLRDEEIHSVIDIAMFRHGMEKKLRESEQRFRTVADFTHDWEYWIDPQNRFVYVSPSCERITGYSAEAFMQKPALLKEIVHPDDRKPFFKHLSACSKVSGNKTIQFRIVSRQGETRWLDHVCRPVHDADGKGLGMRVNNRDITEQKEAENRIMRLNRTLTMMSRINEAVAVVRDPGKLFDRACQIAVRDGKFALAWIGIVAEKTGIVRPAASNGKAKKYVDGLIVTSRGTIDGRGPTGRAVREGKPVVCGDIEKEKAMQSWRDRALQFGLRSSAAFPFMIRDRVIGTLNLYSSEPDYFDGEEIRLFEELTGSLTFALEHMEEEKRQRELEERTRYLASFPEQEPNPIMEVDLAGRVRYVNPALQQLLPNIETAGLRHPWFSGWRSILGSFKRGEKTHSAHETEVNGSHYRQLFNFFPEHGMVRILALDVTERRIAEEALRESESRYRNFVEQSAEGFVMVDEQGLVIEWNRAMEEMTGVERTDVLGSPLWKIQFRFNPAESKATVSLERLKAVIQQLLRTGKAVSFKNPTEFTYRRADGTRGIAHQVIFPIETAKGFRIGATMRDITDRKQDEEKLKQNFREMVILNRVGQQTNTKLTLDRFAEVVISGVVEGVEPDLILLFLVKGGDLHLIGTGPADSKFKHEKTPVHRMGECLCGLCAGQCKPFYVEDIRSDRRCTWKECRQAGIRSFAALPLSSEGEILGVIGLASGTPRDFGKQASFLETFAAEASIGLKNAILDADIMARNAGMKKEIDERKRVVMALQKSEEYQRQFAERLTSLISFINELSKAGSLDDLCRSAVEYAMKRIGFDRAGIWFFSEDRKTQIGSFGADVNGRLQDERNLRLPVDYRPTQVILESREPIVFTDQEELRDEKGKTVGWGNHVTAGLWDGEEIIGIIGVDNLIRRHPITPEDQRLLGFLAVSVGHICTLKRTEEQIKADNREKELMLKEINHRVKNNMQVIASLLNLQSRQTQDAVTLSMFNESRNRIQSMALVHEMLYGSKDLARIDFGRYIENLVHRLRMSYGDEMAGIGFDLDTEAIPLGVDVAIPCGLIIQELVSNALKYAFPRGREGHARIRIGLKRTGGDIELTVGDNGTGLPDSFDFQKVESLGLNLVRMLGQDQLKGNVRIERKKGTVFTIRFGAK